LRVELARAARGEFPGAANWEERLIATFVSSVLSTNSDFNTELTRLLGPIANASGDVSRFQDVISAFRRVAIPCCESQPELRARIEDILQEARLLTAQTAERAEASKRLSLENFTRTLVEVGAALMGTYDLEKLCEAIYVELPRVGITTCYLNTYSNPKLNGGAPSTSVKLVCAYDGERRLISEVMTYPATELVPSALWPVARTSHFQVLPLFLNGLNLGFALVESRAQAAVLEMVRAQLSIAVYGALLANDRNSK
jgi:hypothetical protein